MDKAAAKKEKERRHLDRFKEACIEFPSGDVESTEEPDFLIHDGNRTVGIELTELLVEAESGSHPRGQEALQDRVLMEARKLYEAAGGAPRRVGVYFSMATPLTREGVTPVAAGLASLVSDAPLDGVTLDNEGDDSMPDEIERVTVHPGPVARASWYPNRGGGYGEADVARVQETIDSKSQKVDKYRAKCARVWLVIVVDGFAPSSFMDLSGAAIGHMYRSPFDRVFYFENFDRRVVRLHPPQ